MLYEDRFENLDNWAIEAPAAPTLENGVWKWDLSGGRKGGTAWLKKRFDGPTIIEYDVVSVEGMDNINFLFYATKDENGEDRLLATSEERMSGAYKLFHQFPNYIITYLTNRAKRPDSKNRDERIVESAWRVRFRKNPGFNLMSETIVSKEAPYGTKQHITYVFEADGAMSLYVDGELLHSDKDESAPYRSGYHGFRTWNTRIHYSDFKVHEIISAR